MAAKVRLHSRVSEKTLLELTVLAEEREQKVSELVRHIVSDYLRRLGRL